MTAVSVHDVAFAYPRGFRLQVRRFEVPEGARAGVMGPSGCGKSTLLALLSGEAVPQAGAVTVDGVEVSALGEAARRRFRLSRVGLVMQDHPLVAHLSLLDNVLLPYRLGGGLRLDAPVRDRARGLLGELGLAAMVDARPDALSHGERQRGALARALVTEPVVVLADEPTSGLDPAATDRVVGLLEEACARRSMTLVMVTHDPRLRARFDPLLDLGAP